MVCYRPTLQQFQHHAHGLPAHLALGLGDGCEWRRHVPGELDIVKADECEAGPRRILNLGHTVGHAIEKCSGYRITHGRAVAAGIAVIARAAVKLGFCSAGTATRIKNTLLENGLSVTVPFSADELTAAALGDKKRSGEEITLVLPRQIGDCFLWTIAVADLHSVIAAGLEVIR